MFQVISQNIPKQPYPSLPQITVVTTCKSLTIPDPRVTFYLLALDPSLTKPQILWTHLLNITLVHLLSPGFYNELLNGFPASTLPFQIHSPH